MGASEEKGNGSQEWRPKENKRRQTKEDLHGPKKIVCCGLRDIIWASDFKKIGYYPIGLRDILSQICYIFTNFQTDRNLSAFQNFFPSLSNRYFCYKF